MKRLALFALFINCSATTTAWADGKVAGDAHFDLQLFSEPAPAERMIVVSPSLTANVEAPHVAIEAEATADVVSGATQRTYGKGPDVVTSATHMSEQRVQVMLGARVAVPRTPLQLSVAYRYSGESDYRSHMLRLGLTADLRAIDAQLTARWAHDFDSVCDLQNGDANALARQPLDRSHGCFMSTPGLTEKSLAIDSAELDFQKVLTARLKVGVDLFYAHLNGFQSNPYRRVGLDNDQVLAQESHPTVRDRGALGLSLRWAPPSTRWPTLRGALGANVRLYDDTWAVRSISTELSWEQMHFSDRLRWRVHGRFYQQSAAFFYRDAGWADSYERAGPVGQYFTGDRQNAPLADLTVGGSVHGALIPRPGHRFDRVDVSVSLDAVKVFALSPDPPNRARTTGVVDAVVASGAVQGEF